MTDQPPRIPREIPAWHDTAACKLFPELDFIDAKGPAALACRVVCSVCPVRLACATDALQRGEPWGMWGGLDRKDRKAVALHLGYPPPAVLPEHGTNSRRVKWGCTCADCRRAHAVYEAERRATARAKARQRGAWSSPLLELAEPVRIGRIRLGAGQLLLPLDLPEHHAARPVTDFAEPIRLVAAA